MTYWERQIADGKVTLTLNAKQATALCRELRAALADTGRYYPRLDLLAHQLEHDADHLRGRT